MNYIGEMNLAILALDRLQGSIRVVTVGTDKEVNTLMPLLALYQQLDKVNNRSFTQGICNRDEYIEIDEVIEKRVKRYKEWIIELGGQVK